MKLSIKPDRKLLDMIYKTPFKDVPVNSVFVWRGRPNDAYIKTEVTVQENVVTNAEMLGKDVRSCFEAEDRCLVIGPGFEKRVNAWLSIKNTN